MKYMLTHKDVEVLEFSFSEQRRWARIIDVLNAAHIPVNIDKELSKIFNTYI